MANYYGSARTNYFEVKELEAFKEAMDGLGCDMEVYQQGEGGLVALLVHDENGMFPSQRFDENGEELGDIDISLEVAAHLVEGSVAIFMEVGTEKLRYLSGYSWAVNSDGKVVSVSIDDIYDKAKELTNNPESITSATY